jgi:hypothetical protein
VKKKFIVELKEEERRALKELVTKGKAETYKIQHANILLAADIQGSALLDADIAQALGLNINTIGRIRRRFTEQGLEAALGRKKQDRPSRSLKFDGEAEAHLIAVSCSQPPEGYSQWSLRLLAQRVVDLKIMDEVSYETVRRTLKKMNLSHICGKPGSYPRTKTGNL